MENDKTSAGGVKPKLLGKPTGKPNATLMYNNEGLYCCKFQVAEACLLDTLVEVDWSNKLTDHMISDLREKAEDATHLTVHTHVTI